MHLCARRSGGYPGRSDGACEGTGFSHQRYYYGRSGIRAAYATGRGRVVIRARHEFEEFGKDRTRIIITELPYQVNKRQLIRNIAEQVKEKRLEGISDLRDETDRNGMRVVIELKRDANPQVVLNHLFYPDPAADQFCHQYAGFGGQSETAENFVPAPYH